MWRSISLLVALPQATAGGTGLPAALQADIAQRLGAMASAEKSSVVRAQIHTVQRLQRQSAEDGVTGGSEAMVS
jgi:hypothetical protein